MNLFSEKKNIFLKIVNVILLIWLLTALFFCYTNIINLIMPEPIQTYAEYRSGSCIYFDDLTDEEKDKRCEELYESYKISSERSSYYNKKNLIIALGNVIIIGSALVLLNKKKED